MNQQNNTFMQNQVHGTKAEQQHLIQECLHYFTSLHRKVNTLKYFAKIPACEKEGNTTLVWRGYLITLSIGKYNIGCSILKNTPSATKGAPLNNINV